MSEKSIQLPGRIPEYVDEYLPKYYRAVLQYFDEHSSEAATIDELGTFICEHDQPDADKSRVKIRLHHSTLPKLAETELLYYDTRDKIACYRGCQEEDG